MILCACLVWGGLLLPVQAAGPTRPTATVPPAIIMDGGRLGKVPLVLPQGKPADVVILFVDDPAAPLAKTMIAKLTALGGAVAVVDARAYLAALGGDHGDCLWLSSETEELNHAIQRRLAFPEFRLPVLASAGQGGVLVYTLLAEAPSYSFAGGVSVDFTPAANSKLNFCGVGNAGGMKAWLPAVDLNLPWHVAPAAQASDAITDWVDDVDKADIIQPPPNAGIADTLSETVKPMLESAAQKDPNSLEDLPLIEIPAEKPAPYVAIVWSGDGGWRDLDRTLGQVLAAHGVSVIGVDSLLYFWQPKRPEIVAHDIDRIVDHYASAWKTNHFILIGYSFGADILPFAYNRMAPEEKARIGEMSLLALSRNTRFEITVSEFFSDDATSETRLVGPELTRINPKLVQCFYGEDEADDSACTTPEAAKTELIKTKGGHHFGDDYDALANLIMAGAAKRIK